MLAAFLAAVALASHQQQISVQPFAQGLRPLTAIASTPAEPKRLYAVEQSGRIVYFVNGRLGGTFIDLHGRVKSGGEQGLLSLAFSPNYKRDHLRNAVLLLRDLRDDQVVLVVACESEHEVRRALDPGLLEHEQLGGVPVHRLVLELGLEPLVAVAVLLDDRCLMAVPQERAHDVRARLAAACDQDVHG